MCCCASHLHSLCMPCAAGAHRVVIGCGIVAASVPHRCLDDPWNPLISQLQAPEAASCTGVNALPHTLVCTQMQCIHKTMAVYYHPNSQSAPDRSLYRSHRDELQNWLMCKGNGL